MNKKWFLGLLSALLVLGAACGGDDDGGGEAGGTTDTASPDKAEIPTEEETEAESGAITITAVDYAFQVPPSVAAGETEITFENGGTEPHQLFMALLSEDAPDIEKLIRMPQKKAQPFLEQQIDDAAKPIPPGESTTFTVDLKPGTYGMVCFVNSKKEHKPHAFLGMFNTMTVQ